MLRKHGVINNSDNVDSASQSCYLSASSTTVSRDTIWVATISASTIKNKFGTSFWLYSGVYWQKFYLWLFSGLRKWDEGSWDVSISSSRFSLWFQRLFEEEIFFSWLVPSNSVIIKRLIHFKRLASQRNESVGLAPGLILNNVVCNVYC